VEDAEQGDAGGLLLRDHRRPRRVRFAASSEAVGSSSSRIGMVGDEAARDVDALLLAAGEGRGRQRPEPLRQVEPGQQGGRPLACLVAATPRRDSGSATTSSADTRGTVRRNWLT
jgi:hypothetical protein